MATSIEQVEIYRARTFRLLPDLHLQTKEDALHFVNERGFVYFWYWRLGIGD